MTIAQRVLLLILIMLIGQVADPPPAALADASTLTLRDAIGRLAQERDFAESGAGLLKKYAAQNPAALVKGQKLYAEAKAAFDGLIEQLLTDLAKDEDPESSAELRTTVDSAAEKRLTFSRHVDAVLPNLEGTKNVIVDALAKSVGEIVTGLIDGGIKIWQEFRRGDEQRRKAVATRVEAQRWRAFAEVEPAV
jgi:hypothetical protein